MTFKSTDEYIKSYPDDTQEILEKVRKTIQRAAPEAEESIGYGVAAFKLKNKRMVYYAAFKSHIGLYPSPELIEEFQKELSKYKLSKGTIQFQIDEPIPYDLIEKIVKAMNER